MRHNHNICICMNCKIRMCIQFLLSLFVISSSKVVYSTSPDWPQACEGIKLRKDWGGRTPVAVDYAILPVKYVIIHHTVTPECKTEFSCASTIRGIQEFHMDTMEFHDIGYNFLVGGDGNVYEGASWHKVGAHTRGYNSRSMVWHS
ncbi:unnamed protein product [Callosobruchus maculatus]|uniref:Peptidoglycan recognition protein family domain-containing protein n=1 Tax=Callosobruchus maculatus TaxID=64391 RepID=A0A653D9J2_CALMS|nr:unnamed protein product [Callosobruchus maculatus]